MIRHRSAATVIATIVVAAAESTAFAQAGPASDNVAAEALFEDARNLVAAGKYAEACPKFADSERLGPSPATLLNLANCWEKVGRSATAWATYREAASAANAAGRKDYLATASRHADALGPKLARLTITVLQPAPGMQVRRDGVVVDNAEWGIGIPVDVGSHAVEAAAPGRKAWVVAIQVTQDGAQAAVSVPALEELPAEAAPAAPVAAPTPAPATPASVSPTPSESEAGSNGRTERVVGSVVAGIGVVGLGIGTALAVVAKNKYNDSLKYCETGNPNLCNGTGLSERDSARSMGDGATVAFGVGAAALVAGGILWFTAPRAASSGGATLEVSPTLGGLIARGTW